MNELEEESLLLHEGEKLGFVQVEALMLDLEL